MLKRLTLISISLIWISGLFVLWLSLRSSPENFAEFPNLYVGWVLVGFLTGSFFVIKRLKSKLLNH